MRKLLVLLTCLTLLSLGHSKEEKQAVAAATPDYSDYTIFEPTEEWQSIGAKQHIPP